MQGGGDDCACELPNANSLRQPRLRHTYLPYCSASIATCASASAHSVFPNDSEYTSSQSTDDSSDSPNSQSSQASSQISVSSVSSVSSAGSACLDLHTAKNKPAVAARSWQKQQLQLQQQQQQQQQQKQSLCATGVQPRPNPRRTGVASNALPSLLRQSDRRTTFVDHLVDASTQIVQAIWPLSSVVGRAENAGAGNNGSYLLPLRTFIQETLRRSRASYSTLQVALYYLLLIKPRLPSHNFTMEQPDDSPAARSLQCGRRMFLAALILASKYLQDRNYSARAWSKISGLSTVEINQNETAFLHAVNWRLHITNEVYSRWTDCVNMFNPPHLPPSPGPAVVECLQRKCEEFRRLIQQLSPTLDNVEELCAQLSAGALRRRDSFQMTGVPGVGSPVSFFSSPVASPSESGCVSPNELTVSSKSSAMSAIVPSIMEPCPETPAAFTPGRLAPPIPAMGLLPTPKLAPPLMGEFGVLPAGSIPQGPSQGAGGAYGCRPSMCFAMAQASTSACVLDRWPGSLSSTMSPGGCLPVRRSSLATSVSTPSSPESMISDSSLVSRSSSVSSAWSLMNAPNAQFSSKLDVQARHRFARHQCNGTGNREKGFALRSTAIPAVLEDCETDDCETTTIYASPECMYTGPVGKDIGKLPMALPLDRRLSETEATDAARVLAELQQQGSADATFPPAYLQQQAQLQLQTQPQTQSQQQLPQMVGHKRSRPTSVENYALQESVRDLLRGSIGKAEGGDKLDVFALEPQCAASAASGTSNVAQIPAVDLDLQAAARAAALTGGRKRLCRTYARGPLPGATAATACSMGLDLQHPSMSGLCGPGMWQGILN